MEWVKRDPVKCILEDKEALPELREMMRQLANMFDGGETMTGYEMFPVRCEPDYKSYVCWILSRKHYGKTRKHR